MVGKERGAPLNCATRSRGDLFLVVVAVQVFEGVGFGNAQRQDAGCAQIEKFALVLLHGSLHRATVSPGPMLVRRVVIAESIIVKIRRVIILATG